MIINGYLTVGNTNAIGCSPRSTDWLCSLINIPEEWWPFDDVLLAFSRLSLCTCFMLNYRFLNKKYQRRLYIYISILKFLSLLTHIRRHTSPYTQPNPGVIPHIWWWQRFLPHHIHKCLSLLGCIVMHQDVIKLVWMNQTNMSWNHLPN